MLSSKLFQLFFYLYWCNWNTETLCFGIEPNNRNKHFVSSFGCLSSKLVSKDTLFKIYLYCDTSLQTALYDRSTYVNSGHRLKGFELTKVWFCLSRLYSGHREIAWVYQSNDPCPDGGFILCTFTIYWYKSQLSNPCEVTAYRPFHHAQIKHSLSPPPHLFIFISKMQIWS